MTPSKILARLVEYGPRVIRDNAKPGPRCVLATRVGLDVLARFGLDAAPLPLQVDVCNVAFAQWEIDGAPGGEPEFLARGCWLVSNNPAPFAGRLVSEAARDLDERERWPGHLVVLVRGQLLDLDLQQTARPRHHILPPDALAVRWDGHVAGANFPWGCVRYCPWPTSYPLPEYTHSGDWRKPIDHIVAPIVRAIRKGVL
jgi:hypothetical protein